MKQLKQLFLPFSLLLLLSSCGLFGIHVNLHNPRKPGKYPHFSKETILLGELTPIRKNFGVTFYDLDITIDPSAKTVGGWVEVKATALKDIDSIQLDLDQPLAIEQLKWKTREGENLKYSRRYRAVFIQLNQKIKQGESFSVHIKYSGKPVIARKPPWSGGMVWKKDKLGNNFDGVVCETDGASVWFPCKDHTSDEPDSARLKFTIPDTNLFVVSNGNFIGSEKTNNSKSFTWKISYPINVYNITFYMGDYAKIEDTCTGINSKELKLNYYVLKPNVNRARQHFQQVKQVIHTYEELYGEYPWYNDGYKLIESPYKGQEHQTAIAYGNGFVNDLYKKDDYIILHETGHEWFGNAVTAADLSDVWLQEGFTTYGEALFLEKKYGKETAINHLLNYRIFIKNKLPVVGPVGRRYFDYHDEDVYTKGAWILNTLRNTINNDSVFFTIIKSFYQENKLKMITSSAFIQTVNRITGKDYNWFFNQYLYKNEVPVMEGDYGSDGAFYYRWTNVPEEFNKLPVHLRLGSDSNTLTIFPNSKVQKVDIPLNANGSYPAINFYITKTLYISIMNKKMKSIYDNQQNTK